MYTSKYVVAVSLCCAPFCVSFVVFYLLNIFILMNKSTQFITWHVQYCYSLIDIIILPSWMNCLYSIWCFFYLTRLITHFFVFNMFYRRCCHAYRCLLALAEHFLLLWNRLSQQMDCWLHDQWHRSSRYSYWIELLRPVHSRFFRIENDFSFFSLSE